jgi:hypothetical protein
VEEEEEERCAAAMRCAAFFLFGVGVSTGQVALLSALVYYSSLYGKATFVHLNIFVYIPSLPVVLLQVRVNGFHHEPHNERFVLHTHPAPRLPAPPPPLPPRAPPPLSSPTSPASYTSLISLTSLTCPPPRCTPLPHLLKRLLKHLLKHLPPPHTGQV